MKKIIYLATLLSGICAGEIVAQEADSYKGTVVVTPLALQQQEDSLLVSIDFQVSGVTIDSRTGADFIPVLTSGKQRMMLPRLSVKGRNDYKEYRRSQLLMTRKERAAWQKNAPYAVIKGYKSDKQIIHYNYKLPFESWMESAHLDLQRDLCGCGEIQKISLERLAESVRLQKPKIIEPYQINPLLSYLQPTQEPIKQRGLEIASFLDFASGKTAIHPDYMNNPVELAKIRTGIDELKNDKNVTLNSIRIVGYASPEGTLALNKRLSEARANALKGYLSSYYAFPEKLFSVAFGGENWDGLVAALESSNYSFKADVLSIINHTSIEGGRESQIMRLNKGVPYRVLLKEVFPKLRVALCQVDYSIRSFTVDEAKEVLTTRPQNLSLHELYQVANSYPSGSKEFVEIFETAVRLFPKDETANLNAAVSSLARKDVVAAERYLNQVKKIDDSAEYNNAMGVLCIFKEDYERAEQYLKRAVQSGQATAQHNLDELNKKRENRDRIAEQSTRLNQKH